MNNERLPFIDIAKGIGILLVVIGHLLHSSTLPGMLIYQFHMPFFFLISGYCYNQDKYTGHISMFAKARGMQLLVPLACFNLLLMCLSFRLFPDYTAESFSDHMMGATWFLLVLYGASILYSIIDCVNNNSFKVAILIIFLLCGCVLSFYNINPPYGLACIASAVFYYGVGNLSKRGGIISNLFKKSAPIKLTFCLGTLFVMFSVPLFHLDRIALPEHISLFTSIIPFAGITFAFLLSDWIFSCGKYAIILSWLGKNTMVILCVHMFYISLSCEFVKPYISSYPLYKVTELILVFLASIVSAVLIRRFLPFMLGKN